MSEITRACDVRHEISNAIDMEADRLLMAFDDNADARRRVLRASDDGRVADPLDMSIIAQSRAMVTESMWSLQSLLLLRDAPHRALPDA